MKYDLKPNDSIHINSFSQKNYGYFWTHGRVNWLFARLKATRNFAILKHWSGNLFSHLTSSQAIFNLMIK